MRLHVGILGIEELADALNGECFHLVDHLTAAIVALAGISFGVFICEIRAHGLHHFIADEILGGNQLHAFQLTLMFFLNQVENYLISFHLSVIYK